MGTGTHARVVIYRARAVSLFWSFTGGQFLSLSQIQLLFKAGTLGTKREIGTLITGDLSVCPPAGSLLPLLASDPEQVLNLDSKTRKDHCCVSHGIHGRISSWTQ